MPKRYVTVTRGLRGFFAVLVVDGDAWVTGEASFASAWEAQDDARAMAEAEGVDYVAPSAVLN